MTKRFEYKIELIPPGLKDKQDQFNALGAEGWQFASQLSTKNHALFQREAVPVREPYEREPAQHTEHSKHNAVELLSHIASDHKIEAIRAYRALTGFGLVDSKNAVETVTRLIKR